MSSLVISAVIDEAGRLVDPGDAALDVGLLDRRDLSRAGPWRPCPTGSALSDSTEVTCLGIDLDDEVDGLAVRRS